MCRRRNGKFTASEIAARRQLSGYALRHLDQVLDLDKDSKRRKIEEKDTSSVEITLPDTCENPAPQEAMGVYGLSNSQQPIVREMGSPSAAKRPFDEIRRSRPFASFGSHSYDGVEPAYAQMPPLAANSLNEVEISQPFDLQAPALGSHSCDGVEPTYAQMPPLAANSLNEVEISQPFDLQAPALGSHSCDGVRPSSDLPSLGIVTAASEVLLPVAEGVAKQVFISREQGLDGPVPYPSGQEAVNYLTFSICT
ncbi:hypothetical protein BHE90_016943 [Fusarium euwallaceae]|uniref:Uncharacterized protein n=1 Tax=Fusarium euwallaceae TaxID=1147111 RepID=A0A430KYY4_9HYPO|nr:hypothetical protein BHE90_016943 [Fusarium euwallaceae]